ncbi:MAG: DUF655 domain-containing protein [Candidatus Aenigmatarchaeota archaeon]|nr:MAG: DUF655 domain-containing protein [Candidatus Aenigmarchaeota archaeon]
MKDDWAYVLDFLPRGHPGQRKEEPIAQVIGDRFFSLLEVVPKEGVELYPEDRVYIGRDNRDKVKFIRRSITVNELTAAARSELENIVEKIVEEKEKRFVEFFNKAGPITTRMHSLEVLPGVGRKHMWEILEARKEKPFESYEDLKERVPLIPNPKKMIIKRIMEELTEPNVKYPIFVLSKRREF